MTSVVSDSRPSVVAVVAGTFDSEPLDKSVAFSISLLVLVMVDVVDVSSVVVSSGEGDAPKSVYGSVFVSVEILVLNSTVELPSWLDAAKPVSERLLSCFDVDEYTKVGGCTSVEACKNF